jgi:hypothetical protein
LKGLTWCFDGGLKVWNFYCVRKLSSYILLCLTAFLITLGTAHKAEAVANHSHSSSSCIICSLNNNLNDISSPDVAADVIFSFTPTYTPRASESLFIFRSEIENYNPRAPPALA